MDVAVVGGGAVGVTAARELAVRGVEVTLYERGDLASGASGRAAGVCYDAFADPTDAELARESLARFRDLSADAGEFSFTPCPYVWLAREGDERRADAIRGHVPRMRDAGLAVEFLDPADLAAEFPGVRTDDVAVAAVARDAGYADPAAYTRTVAERARAAGADLRTGARVALAALDADAVVVAAGAHTADLLADAGHPVPLKPYRVQALVTRETPVSAAVPMLYDATGGYYLRPRSGGLFVGDGTEPVERDPDDWNREADAWFVENCAEHLERAVGTAPDPERAWAGLCTATPDGDPLVGERVPGVFVAAGWQGHGFMRAPAMGRLVADCVLGEESPFDPERFDGDEEFEIVEGMVVEER